MGAACISNRQTDDDERYETNSPIPKKKGIYLTHF